MLVLILSLLFSSVHPFYGSLFCYNHQENLRKFCFHTNGRFSTQRSVNITMGQELELQCLGDTRTRVKTCTVVTPSGEEWSVSASGVTDMQGNWVPGVTPIVSHHQNFMCGVLIDR